MSEYVKSDYKILVRDKYGICEMLPHSIIKGQNTSIKSAFNKYDYIKNKILERNPKILEDFNFIKIDDDINYIILKDEYGILRTNIFTILNGSYPSIRCAVNYHEYFTKRLKCNHPSLFDHIISFKTNIDKDVKDIIVETKYGDCIIKKSNLMVGKLPSIKSAINKEKYFHNAMMDIHSQMCPFEIIGEYRTNSKKILVKDVYGECDMSPSSLLSGHLPSIRSAVNKTEYFIGMARNVHGDEFDYSLCEYKNAKTNLKIICSKHGLFEQKPHCHLKCGCPICSLEKTGFYNKEKAEKNSQYFKNTDGVVYLIKIFDENEEFYKIGMTKRGVKYRFRSNGNSSIPYNYNVLLEYKTTLYNAVYIEDKLISVNESKKYVPNKYFVGYTECFKDLEHKDIIDTIIKEDEYVNAHN